MFNELPFFLVSFESIYGYINKSCRHSHICISNIMKAERYRQMTGSCSVRHVPSSSHSFYFCTFFLTHQGVRPTVKIRGPSQRAVKLGSNVTLQCDISYPAYLKTAHMFWLNETVQRRVANRTLPSDNTAIKTFALYLNITNINRQDLGFYICGVNTSIGIYDTQLELRLHRGTY